jgi:hypothetical protein
MLFEFLCFLFPTAMELLCQTHAHACVLALCTDPCLHPGEHLKDRVSPSVNPVEGARKDADAFGTWLALGAEWVTIAKYDDSTLVYIPSQDAFYYASPACILSQECPRRTVFLGQFVIDNDSTPRVLVHDLVRLHGTSFADMPARERYSCLQQLGDTLGPVCTVQWVGECRVLGKELKSGRFKVPHAVRSVIALTAVPGKVKVVE